MATKPKEDGYRRSKSKGRTLKLPPKKDRVVKIRPTGRGLPWPYSEEEMGLAILECRGNINKTAKYLGCGRTTLNEKIRDSEFLQEVVYEARSAVIDDLEETLYDKALGGDTIALIFALKTQGRDRGWNEHQVIEVRDDSRKRERDAEADAKYFAEVMDEYKKLLGTGDSGEIVEGEFVMADDEGGG